MSEIIVCPNLDCKAENPANAKFCRMCQHPLSTSEDDYTPGLFPDIALRPVAVQPVHFVNAVEKLSFIVLPLLLLFLYLLCRVFKDDFIVDFDRGPFFLIVGVGAILSVLLIIICINGIKHHSGYAAYMDNTDYIEEGFFMQKTRRIAKNKKLGLFDNKTKRVLLTPDYDLITQFDETHIQLGVGNKIGLYSLALKRIIVPIEYDGIAPVKNGVIEVVKDSHMSHFDIHGNVLK